MRNIFFPHYLSGEPFNAKIKQFRALLRGVIDIPFFLFRLTKIYA